VNPLRLIKIYTRGTRLLDTLDDAAATPRLYLDPLYRSRVLTATAALVEVLPLPRVWRETTMGLLTNLRKNWKTTVIGLATGAGIAFLSGVQGGLTPRDAALAAGVAALGLAAKDSTVSGR
jgi:hypothetical protein